MEICLPNSLIAASNKPSELYLLKDRYLKMRPIFMCVDNTCKFPVSDVKQAINLMED